MIIAICSSYAADTRTLLWERASESVTSINPNGKINLEFLVIFVTIGRRIVFLDKFK